MSGRKIKPITCLIVALIVAAVMMPGNKTSPPAPSAAPAPAKSPATRHVDDEYGMVLRGMGPIPENAAQRAAAHRKKMIQAQEGAPATSFADATWEELGPGNAGGRVRAFVIDPMVADRLILGAAGGGIWISTNDGASWAAVDDTLDYQSISCLAMDPNDRTVLYAGTGEAAFPGSSSTTGQGIYKSTDAGLSWTLLESTGPNAMFPAQWTMVTRIAVSPANSNRVIATTTSGAFVSCDAGTSWSRTFIGDVKDVVFHPTNGCTAVIGLRNGTIFYSDTAGRFCPGVDSCTPSGTIWTQATLTGNPASTSLVQYRVDNTDPMNPLYFLDVNATTQFQENEPIIVGPMAIQRTVNQIVDGDTLQIDQATAGLNPGDTVASVPTGRIELAWSRSNPNIVYAGVNVSQGVIYRSNDGGQTFNFLSNSDHLASQGEYGNQLWVDPTNPNTLVAGGIGLYRSTDGGMTFDEIGCGSHADVHLMVEDPGYDGSSNKRVYQANDGGVYVTNDIFAPEAPNPPCNDFGWTHLSNNLGITQFYYAAVNSEGKIVGGTQDNGTWIHDPPGPGAWDTETWVQVTGGDGWECTADPTDPDVFYLIIGPNPGRGALRKSTNGGLDYSLVPGTPDPSSPSLLDVNNASRMILGRRQLQVTNDIKSDTPTWRISKDFLDPADQAWEDQISANDIAPGNSNVMWVGHINGDVFRSTAALSPGCPTPTCATCSCWTKVDDPPMARQLPDRVVSYIKVDPNDINRVYVSLGPWEFEGDNVWMTENGLDPQPDWRPISGFDPTVVAGVDVCDPALRPATALPCEPVRLILPHQTQQGLIYVGTWFGMYASEDFGLNWERVGLPVPFVLINDLDWQSDSQLLVTTHGRGLWRASGVIPDCNENTIADNLDILVGTSQDCNANTIPDECDVGSLSEDCNVNGIPDECDFNPDCNGNGILDDCEGDCNGNGQPDDCDIADALPVSLFDAIDPMRFGRDSSSIVVGDFDGDGFDDLATTIFASEGIPNAVVVYLNRGENASDNWLGWEDPDGYSFPGAPSVPWALTTLDVNDDGALDLAAIVGNSDMFPPCIGCGNLHVGINNGSGIFSWDDLGVVTLGFFPGKEAIAAGDTDGDGDDDVVIADTDRGDIYFRTSSPLYFFVGGDPEAVAVARFNPDAHPDVAVANSSLAEVEVLINDGSGNFGKDVRRIAVGGTPVSIDVGDVNKDGFTDIVTANTIDIAILINQTDGNFLVSADPGAYPATTVRLVDVDRDTWLDIVTTEDSPFQTEVRLNNRDGTFGTPFFFNFIWGVSLTAGQFNGDGFTDLAAITAAGVPWIAGNDTIVDCNDNGVPDTCDIDSGWDDADMDGLLDYCEGEDCDQDGDGDCDLADWRIMMECFEGPGEPCDDMITSEGATFRADVDGDFDFDLRDFAILSRQFGGERGCCVAPHPGGCINTDWENCVCGVHPECCSEQWTAACVVAVEILGCGSCADVPRCGDDICDIDESCITCAVDCGNCDGDCCAPNGTAGCATPAVQSCVCGLDPTCCADEWSSSCAAIASESCQSCCGNGSCNPGESCWNCPDDCGDCASLCPNDNCEPDESCVSCPLDCGPCLGDCCQTHFEPGCGDRETQDCVCAMEPACCTGPWDATCAQVAADTCSSCCGNGSCEPFESCETCPDDCGACIGSCCLANEAPGCIDEAVEACVCAFDPFCCENTWDQLCATEAEQCGSCGGDCCSANGTPGCNQTPVEVCVCEEDPFCCLVEWDGICVGEVGKLGCGDCPPTVVIIQPDEDTSTSDPDFVYDGFDDQLQLYFKDVPLTGSAVDPEDGQLSGADLVWTTDRIDIQPGGAALLGSGSSITARLYSNICTGVWHEITLTATDSAGNNATATRMIFIWSLCD